MASVSKSFLADAGYGEQELNADAALMELDKGKPNGGRGGTCGTMCACANNVLTSALKEVPPARFVLSAIVLLGLSRRMKLL